MKLLVTGGAGFIGSNFIRYWAGVDGWDTIINFDALTYAGNLENLHDLSLQGDFEFRKGNITHRKSVARIMKGVDTVVHFAAESHVDRSVLDPSLFVKTNVLGTQILLEEALRAGVRHFHHVSTDEVYGSLELGSGERFNEQTAHAPNSPYAASKSASDMLVRAYHKTYGLPVTITNTSNNYGPYQFPEKLIPLMIIKALAGERLPVYGDGLNVRDWIHVEDHCRAIELVLHKGQIGETYCVGGDNEIANIDIVKRILARLGKPESLIEYVKDRPGHDRRYALDSSKIKQLGFTWKHDFESGLNATIDWYLNNQSWWQRVMNQEYRDYYQKQYKER